MFRYVHRFPAFIGVLTILVCVGQSHNYYHWHGWNQCPKEEEPEVPYCRRDVDEAFQDAFQRISTMRELEGKLFEKSRIISRQSKIPDSSLQRASAADPKTRSNEEVQWAFEMATDNLRQRNYLSDEAVRDELPQTEACGAYGGQALNQCEELQRQNEVQCDPSAVYRSIDGSCNNLRNPDWGRAFSCFQRLLPASYVGASGFRQSVQGGPLPEPRTISLNVHGHSSFSNKYLSHMYMYFGQLLDHDISFTPQSVQADNQAIQCCPLDDETHPQCIPINISPNDPFYSNYGVSCINLVRSAMCRTCRMGHRIQPNQVTAFIDGSFVYSNMENETDALRANDGTGMLRFQDSPSGQLLPPSPDPDNDQCSYVEQNQICFLAGDARANQHITLTSLQTLFLREHNRIAIELRRINPRWDEETLFQETRRIIGAEMQVIAYKEYLPITLGSRWMSHYQLWLSKGELTQYNPNLNPTLHNEFSTAAFRFGHSMVNSLGAWNIPDESTQLLRDHFFEPFSLYFGYMGPMLSGVTQTASQSFDRKLVPDITNYLYRTRGNATGQDLASFNIQRGRDHGIPPYVDLVRYCSGGQLQIEDFNDLARSSLMCESNVEILSRNYRDVRDIDLWTGILSETSNENAVVGPTATCILGLQFQNLKFGDRFYFEHSGQQGSFTYGQIEALKKTSLSEIICVNTDVPVMPKNAMLFPHKNNPLLHCKHFYGLDLSEWRS